MSETATGPSWTNPELTEWGINVGPDFNRHYEYLQQTYGPEWIARPEVVVWVDRTDWGFGDFAGGLRISVQDFKIKMRKIAERESKKDKSFKNPHGVELKTISWADYYPLCFDMREVPEWGV
mgnify:CR=1 FL=1